MVLLIEFTIPGEPVPKGRPRVTMHGTFTPKKTQLAEQAVKGLVKGMPKFEARSPLGAQIDFYMKIPMSAPKSRQKAMADGKQPPVKRPDLDNLAKLVLDALNGELFPDDSAIVELSVNKYYDENPRTVVKMWEVET